MRYLSRRTPPFRKARMFSFFCAQLQECSLTHPQHLQTALRRRRRHRIEAGHWEAGAVHVEDQQRARHDGEEQGDGGSGHGLGGVGMEWGYLERIAIISSTKTREKKEN